MMNKYVVFTAVLAGSLLLPASALAWPPQGEPVCVPDGAGGYTVVVETDEEYYANPDGKIWPVPAGGCPLPPPPPTHTCDDGSSLPLDKECPVAVVPPVKTEPLAPPVTPTVTPPEQTYPPPEMVEVPPNTGPAPEVFPSGGLLGDDPAGSTSDFESGWELAAAPVSPPVKTHPVEGAPTLTELPFTGLDAWLLGLMGVSSCALGLAMRRRLQ